MFGELSAVEIEKLLRDSLVGRIGCHAEDKTYVVPIAYAYDGECAYAHAGDGLKVRTMRANPNICFEVEDIRSISEWRSVIAFGSFEELFGHEEEEAARRLRERFAHAPPSAKAHPDHRRDVERSIFYRLRLTEKTGRFERH